MSGMLRTAVRNHPLVAFFGLAYAICAATFALIVAYPGLTYGPLWLVGIFSPTISALAVAALHGGRAEVRHLLAGFTRWRIGLRWYLAISLLLLGPLAITLVYIAGGHPPQGVAPGTSAWSWIGALGYTLIAGPLAEEAGWRGFALPRLQQRSSALWASVVLGVLWFAWHIPQYFVPGTTMIPPAISLPICVALAILFTWFYNNTGGSLVATVLAHFLFNFDGAWLSGRLGLAPPMVINIAGGIGIGLMVVVVVAVAGSRSLSRKPSDQLPFQRVGVA